MSSFHFPLQRLLDLRQRAEDDARCQLASSQRQVQHHQALLTKLQEASVAARDEASPALGQPVQPSMLLNNGLYAARLRMQAAAQQGHVTRSVSQESVDRAVLGQKAQGRRTLERLRERQQELHVTAQTHRERQSVEETAAMMFAAGRNGNGSN